jgi:hypothetical protein
VPGQGCIGIGRSHNIGYAPEYLASGISLVPEANPEYLETSLPDALLAS